MILVERGKQLICGNSSGFQHTIHSMNILGGDNGNIINNNGNIFLWLYFDNAFTELTNFKASKNANLSCRYFPSFISVFVLLSNLGMNLKLRCFNWFDLLQTVVYIS